MLKRFVQSLPPLSLSSMPNRFNPKSTVRPFHRNHYSRRQAGQQQNQSYSKYPRNDYARQMDRKNDLLHVRNLPKDTRHGMAMYKAATTKVKNTLAKSHESWINKFPHFERLNQMTYKPSATEPLDKYLTQIETYYKGLQKKSNESLAGKIEVLDKQWIKQSGKVPDVKLTDDKDAVAYKKQLKDLKKSHYPTVYCSPGSTTFDYLHRSIELLSSRSTILFSFDIEAFELDNSVVTEVGISIFDPRENMTGLVPITRNFHIIVSEALSLRNKKWVCDLKECYLMGQSLVLNLNETVEFIQSLINYYMVESTEESRTWNRAYVGHNIDGDIKWLQNIGVEIPFVNKLNKTLNESSKGIPYVLDTMKLYNGCYGPNGGSLGKILRLFGLPHAFLHNAGNDAHYTLELLMHMCDINFRTQYGLDDLDKFQRRAQEFMDRSKIEPKVLPISYSITMKDVARTSKPKKDLVPQTEFGGSKWFASANEAFESTIEYTGSLF
ncbi:similar to Saccharomyces cerevisiae YDR514C Protein of unknown function that localizes to mitochondria [Maudiozyma barnettii]|uniref:Gfd2/YDR514C-like C-terminal domain-containing protein n=1 Tax=Maudiozyma barnettii TaxID=61262 RepID=A0A8H2VGX6_9SACH|nr:hypothetical protein [Kazachstania barnettii]CAB4255231.1 similar to Saccharomyces cerevisiae YDR514C Protein of unknown function that localizes to mitochondria [Kazachstania barnettii]CAD1783639.1 similar to Saccharomyces cerevisiae YDR514C Protein of unknown function that localizes to mitochondria [Kazachstania barnettii]